jgi:hypothetical protein
MAVDFTGFKFVVTLELSGLEEDATIIPMITMKIMRMSRFLLTCEGFLACKETTGLDFNSPVGVPHDGQNLTPAGIGFPQLVQKGNSTRFPVHSNTSLVVNDFRSLARLFLWHLSGRRFQVLR